MMPNCPPPPAAPFTDAEIRAAGLLNAIQDASHAFASLTKAWRESAAQQAAARRAEEKARLARLRACQQWLREQDRTTS